MDYVVVENLMVDKDLPSVEVNIHASKKKAILYSAVMKFDRKQFICYRIYNGQETQSAVGQSPIVDYEDLIKKGVDKNNIINIMKGQITYAINDRCFILNDLYKTFIECPAVFPHKISKDQSTVERFLEICYFTII